MRKQLTFFRARLLLLVLGAGFAIGQTVLAWDRGAPPSEVLAPALYVPLFAGAIFWGITGGLIAAASCSLIYSLVLVDQSEALGIRAFVGLLVSRITTYILYGLVIAGATRYIESRLAKLELYDQIDDLTGLFNSKFFLESTELEMERSKRYRTLFCVSELDVARETFTGIPKKRYERVIRELSKKLEQGPGLRFDDPFHRRATDQPVRIDDGQKDRFFILLPETPPQGAAIFTEKIERATRELLTERGFQVDGRITSRVVAFPEDPEHPGWDASSEDLVALRQEIQAVDEARRAITK
jgi:hypothetical protein